jgi:hypothetical protein
LIINDKAEAQSIFESEKQMKDLGHKVRIRNLTGKELLNEGSHIISKIEKDITNRGVSLGMSTGEKLEKYLEINEVENKEKYLEIGRLLCNMEEIPDLKDSPTTTTKSTPQKDISPSLIKKPSEETKNSEPGLFELDL